LPWDPPRRCAAPRRRRPPWGGGGKPSVRRARKYRRNLTKIQEHVHTSLSRQICPRGRQGSDIPTKQNCHENIPARTHKAGTRPPTTHTLVTRHHTQPGPRKPQSMAASLVCAPESFRPAVEHRSPGARAHRVPPLLGCSSRLRQCTTATLGINQFGFPPSLPCACCLAAPEPVPCLACCLWAGHRRTEANLWFVPAVTPDNPRCNSPPRATSWPRTAAASSGEGSLTKGRKESFSTTRRHLKKPGKASHHDSQAFYAKRACLQAFPDRDAVTMSLV
jgi:hypothetical protein